MLVQWDVAPGTIKINDLAEIDRRPKRSGVAAGVTLSENACGLAPGTLKSAAMMTVPTIEQLAAGDEAAWFWAHCPLPCSHAGALPWAAVFGKRGPHASTDRLRRALCCTVCGHKGGTITTVSRPRHDLPPQPIPLDRVPAWATKR